MAYATPDDLLKRYDRRRVGQLVRDDGTEASTSDLNSDGAVLAALEDASGAILAAVQVGGRYTASDLDTLLDTATGGSFLKRLTCDLAYGYLVARRGYPAAEQAQLAPMYEAAQKQLAALGAGLAVFDVAGVVAATKPVRAKLSKNVRLITSHANRYYGELSSEDDL